MSSQPNFRNYVPANAFENVTISGIASCDIHLTRGKPQRNKPIIDDQCKKRPPKRMPSDLPPAGTMKLSLSIGNMIGDGAAGGVYEATIQYDHSSPELRDMAMPPLVVKISRRRKPTRLAREAFYYEEMEYLQGCVIPRYYGLFDAMIPSGCDFKPWSEDAQNHQHCCHQLSSDSNDSLSDFPPKRKAKKAHAPPSPLSILILERVGERLSMAQTRSQALRDELEEMYKHLAILGLDHCDIRYQNILRAPNTADSLPSLPSLFSERTYAWRIIDFDLCRKSNVGFGRLSFQFHQLLGRLLFNLPHSYLSEE
ncbi:hypothetical protein QCA50_004040 [Cerrena zonata]|uniref:Protein kinase domain-containing protein n=1 Tax=Cerrena zonata TaxID=2478898 RepID=A0AAW0GGH2_9APHY